MRPDDESGGKPYAVGRCSEFRKGRTDIADAGHEIQTDIIVSGQDNDLFDRQTSLPGLIIRIGTLGYAQDGGYCLLTEIVFFSEGEETIIIGYTHDDEILSSCRGGNRLPENRI